MKIRVYKNTYVMATSGSAYSLLKPKAKFKSVSLPKPVVREIMNMKLKDQYKLAKILYKGLK
jgi:hypothetical protein